MADARALIIPNKFRDPYYFEEIIGLQNAIFSGRGELNLSKVAFIEPYSMVSLLLMGRTALRQSGNKLRLSGIPINIHQYLHRMDFFKYGIFTVPEALDEKLLLKRSSFSRTVIEIIEIPNKERESLKVISGAIDLFRRRAGHILRYWITEMIVDLFVTVISEICQNIFEHSLDSGFLAMQTYSVGRENIVRLVISDSGIGIRKSFESKADIRYSSSAELIEMALTRPISSKREFGYGLCQVHSIVEKLRGSIFIRSENASLAAHYHRGQTNSGTFFQKNDLPHFDGTQISISLSA